MPLGGDMRREGEDEIGGNKRDLNLISNIQVQYKVLYCSFRIQCDNYDIHTFSY